jgi:hypothetical protein
MDPYPVDASVVTSARPPLPLPVLSAAAATRVAIACFCAFVTRSAVQVRTEVSVVMTPLLGREAVLDKAREHARNSPLLPIDLKFQIN